MPGFRAAQRFKAEGTSPPRYMAMYTIESAAVFDSAAYRDAGGGGSASARFRAAYREWGRNLFDAEAAAPLVGAAPLGVRCRRAKGCRAEPGRLLWLRSVGLHETTPYRALAVIPSETLGEAMAGAGAIVYSPLTEQLAP